MSLGILTLSIRLRMIEKDDQGSKAYAQILIDCFAQLSGWGAPWHKSWMELAVLEKRYSIEEIERMVDERSNHPDFNHSQAVNYPDKGWIKDLLDKTNPGFYESQVLSGIIGDIASSMSNDLKELVDQLTDEEKEQKKIAISMLKEFIEAMSNYCPDTLDEKGRQLFSKTRDILISNHKLQLNGLLNEDSQNFVVPQKESTAEKIGDLVSHAQDTAEYQKKQSVFGFGDEDSVSGLEEEEPEAKAISGTNPKRLIFKAYNELIRNQPDFQLAMIYVSKALSLLDNFIDPETGDLDREKLNKVALRFKSISFREGHGMYINGTADIIKDKGKFDEARKLLLLDYTVKGLFDYRNPGYARDTDELFHKSSLAICLFGLKRYDEALETFKRVLQLAELYTSSSDVTERTIHPFYAIRPRYYILILNIVLANTDAANLIWQELVEDCEFNENITLFMGEIFVKSRYDWLAILLNKYLLEASSTDAIPQVVSDLKASLIDEAKSHELPADHMNNFITYLNENNYSDLYKYFVEH